MLTFVSVIVVLGLLIAFHELGHFLAAKGLGIGVKSFSLGFPPKLLAFKYGQTEYRISALPLGGYVQLVGERDVEDLPEGFTPAQSFALRPPWQRMLVVAAGPFFNFILAWLLFWGIFWAHGLTEALPVVGEVTQQSAAAEAGLQTGDRVLAIDGKELKYWSELSRTIESCEGRAMRFTLRRGEQTLDAQLTPRLTVDKNIFGEEKKYYRIGVRNDPKSYEVLPLGLGKAAGVALERTWKVISLTGQTFVKLAEAVVPLKSVGGPLMIMEMVADQAKEGLSSLAALTAFISINLGVLNLLPIPVLDGGLLLFLGIEAVRRKPVSERVMEITTKFGLALLLLLMILATYNDLQRRFPWLSLY